jgi:hypothetical protein
MQKSRAMIADAYSFTFQISHARMILAILAVLVLGVALAVWLNRSGK